MLVLVLLLFIPFVNPFVHHQLLFMLLLPTPFTYSCTFDQCSRRWKACDIKNLQFFVVPANLLITKLYHESPQIQIYVSRIAFDYSSSPIVLPISCLFWLERWEASTPCIFEFSSPWLEAQLESKYSSVFFLGWDYMY